MHNSVPLTLTLSRRERERPVPRAAGLEGARFAWACKRRRSGMVPGKQRKVQTNQSDVEDALPLFLVGSAGLITLSKTESARTSNGKGHPFTLTLSAQALTVQLELTLRHRGPLPMGEGKRFPALEQTHRAVTARAAAMNGFPLRSGEGQGEGEALHQTIRYG
jgi:hypothetical protein